MSARGSSAKMYTVDGEKLKNDILDKGFSIEKVSEGILNLNKSTLSGCLRRGVIAEENMNKLCYMFGFNLDDYILKEVKPDVTVSDNPAPSISDNSEVVKALNTLIALQTEQNKKLDILQASITALVEGQKKMQEHLDIDLDSIDDSLSKVNSNMNVANGRLRDICSHEQKTATKLKTVAKSV